MRRSVAVTVLTAALAAAGAPVASADHALVSCLTSEEAHPLSGPATRQVIAVAAVQGGAAEPVGIRCVVRVGGIVRAATPWVAGSGAAWSAGGMTYTRAAGESVVVCAQYTTSHEAAERCFGPPIGFADSPYDTVDWLDPLVEFILEEVIWSPYTDAALCPELRKLTGSYGLVEIGRGGDVYVAGGRVWDCPPYADPPRQAAEERA